MGELQKAWNEMLLNYQRRYARYAKKFAENPEDKYALGHLHECSFVLINVFGLSNTEVDELEAHNFIGLTKRQLEAE